MRKGIKKIVCCLLVSLLLVPPTVWAKITVYMLGDSTMQDWNAGYYPKHGWGQDFQYFFDPNYVTVYNAGAGGTYSTGYYANNWPAVKAKLKAGDYVFIQFGANDGKYKTTDSAYIASMGAIMTEARAMGAYPIGVTSIRRAIFTNADSIYEAWHQYPGLMRTTAAKYSAPLIDLDTLSRDLMIREGQAYTHNYLMMVLDATEYGNYASGQSDNLHMQQTGANWMGRMATEQLRFHSDDSLRALAKYLKPMYQVNVVVNPIGADSLTSISTYYPQGMTVTLKTTPKANGAAFKGWYDGRGNLVSTNSETTVKSSKMITFVMGAASTQYTAVYENGSAQKYTGTGAALQFTSSASVKSSSSVGVTSSSSSGVIASSSSSEAFVMEFKSLLDVAAPDSFSVGTCDTNHTGFIGSCFWNFENALGSTATYNLVSPSAGYINIGVIYANGGTTNRDMRLYLGDHLYDMSFPSTGSWDVWDTAYTDLDIMNGEGSLKFESLSSDGGPNMSAFGFDMAGITRKSGGMYSIAVPVGMGAFRMNAEMLYSPVANTVDLRVISLNGRTMFQKTLSLHAGANKFSLKNKVSEPGVYEVVVSGQRKTLTHFKWANVR